MVSPAVPTELQVTTVEPARHAGVYARRGKRLFDLAVVLPLLPLALAVGVPIALWNAFVFRDPRKVLFVQERVGKGGKRFRILKFRTMREPRRSAADSWFSGGDAARVTRFGRLLRNTHLDELPQVINILRGDMHLVGPRPEMPDVHEWAAGEIPGFEQRLAVRPGLTGLAQVTQGYTGASVECYAEKLAIDTEYIARLSLRTDLEVVLRTVPWMLQGRGWSWNGGKKAPGCDAGAEADAELKPAARPLERGEAAERSHRELARTDVA